MKYYFIFLIFAVIAVATIAGFRGQKSSRSPIEIFNDMDRQPKKKAQTQSDLFADGITARRPIEGTVPMGYEIPETPVTPESQERVEFKGHGIHGVWSSSNSYADTGRMGAVWGDGIPMDVTPAVIQRGRERYEISCAVCHGSFGDGKGIVNEYGFTNLIADLHQQRLIDQPDGELYNTIANGKGLMMSYGDKLNVQDRWAVVAYVRALQRSQKANLSDVAEADRGLLDNPDTSTTSTPSTNEAAETEEAR